MNSLGNNAAVSRIPYSGKATFCHTHALLSLLSSTEKMPNPWLLECLTTVPFGIVHILGDPNRLIDSYFDPDKGLDRALESLGISFETCSWPPGYKCHEAIQLLDRWCDKSPVLIGPINMGDLPYYFHRELYTHVDHYIVVRRKKNGEYLITDPEGFPLVFISEGTLLDAWRGDKIPEGRGAFVIRRIIDEVPVKVNRDIYIRTLRLGIENMENAQALPDGGGNCLRKLAKAGEMQLNASLKRGFTYAVPTRIQRCVSITIFLHEADHEIKMPYFAQAKERALAVLHKQIELYGQTLTRIMEGTVFPSHQLNQIAQLEDDLTTILKKMGVLL